MMKYKKQERLLNALRVVEKNKEIRDYVFENGRPVLVNKIKLGNGKGQRTDNLPTVILSLALTAATLTNLIVTLSILSS